MHSSFAGASPVPALAGLVVARLVVALLCVAALPACSAQGDDTAANTDTDTFDTVDTNEQFTCDNPEIHVNGTQPPSVGDYWEVLLWCDNTLMTGAMHMSIDPPDMATIEDYKLTWNLAGTGSLTVQVGTIAASEDVTVAEAAN